MSYTIPSSLELMSRIFQWRRVSTITAVRCSWGISSIEKACISSISGSTWIWTAQSLRWCQNHVSLRITRSTTSVLSILMLTLRMVAPWRPLEALLAAYPQSTKTKKILSICFITNGSISQIWMNFMLERVR